MWFKGIQCFPEALLLLSVGGGVTLRGREINIYRGREWGWECAADTEGDETQREREMKELCLSTTHLPASRSFSSLISASLFFFWSCPSVLLVFPLPLCSAAAPVTSSVMWSNRSPDRRRAMLISPWKQWHTRSWGVFMPPRRHHRRHLSFCLAVRLSHSLEHLEGISSNLAQKSTWTQGWTDQNLSKVT